ncbi:MAG: hypothetical protein ACOC1G_00035 [Phycisphaeraceae bacterium]
MQATHSSRYEPIVATLARQAAGSAEDRTPHAPRSGEAVFSCIRMLPLVRRALGETGIDITDALAALVEAADADAPRFTDGIGHSREVYHHLCLRLARCAVRSEEERDAFTRAQAWPATRCDHDTNDVSVALWRLVGARGSIDDDALIERVDAWLDKKRDGGSLQPQTPEDSPDHWTFRELAGLHAVACLADAFEAHPCGGRWSQRVREVATFHQDHTQPDYTTYQPWAVAVFARDQATANFAEQQLHDVETHLTLHGGGGAVIPALLLADATRMLTP